MIKKTALSLSVLAILLLNPLTTALAQDAAAPADKATISRGQTNQTDQEISQRLRAIFNEIPALSGVTLTVREGVVILSGNVASDSAAERAFKLAQRIDGAVEVEDAIERTRSVEDNLNPLIKRTEDVIVNLTSAWPLYAVATLAFLLVSVAGHLIASAGRFWRWVAPNPFIARLIAQSVRIISLLAGMLLALSILDAMALFGAAAGGAGLVGLAVGFAVKDTIENYIASVMLSLRQPFRADDHVVINDLEGVVVRLTSRATILMTLDGNHLRIPNADVFKGVILNYTLNPQRRFSFKLGIDANDDPIDAANAGLEALRSLDFILTEPQASAGIDEVGDSNIVLVFYGWLDQRETDFQKARSAAINVVKTVLENQGFTLPEPIYRVKLEGLNMIAGGEAGDRTVVEPSRPAKPVRTRPSPVKAAEPVDVSPDEDVMRQVAEDRAKTGQEDLLSDKRPIE